VAHFHGRLPRHILSFRLENKSTYIQGNSKSFIKENCFCDYLDAENTLLQNEHLEKKTIPLNLGLRGCNFMDEILHRASSHCKTLCDCPLA
jgi:hypothetical protein